MRILGIDYGKKRVGVALSDEGAGFAFPETVLSSSKQVIDEIEKLALNRQVKTIVLGESKDLGGRENQVMEEILKLKGVLESRGFTVVLEPEYFSSVEAARFQGEKRGDDASAAAIILQRYLDKQKGALS
jgi:putative Holliday junction resolvase